MQITLNITQHPASPEQLAAGVINAGDRAMLSAAMTFDSLPYDGQVTVRAETLAGWAALQKTPDGEKFKRALIGGVPFLMAPLIAALRKVEIEPVFAFSVRDSVESVQADGSVRKTAIFRHGGFVVAE